MSKLFILLLVSTLLIFFYSCSASTDTRYSKDLKKEIPEKKVEQKVAEDDFDVTPFRTKIEIPIEKEEKQLDLWFEYPIIDSANQMQKTIADTIPGYRVQVLSTDNLEEANGIRSDIFFKTNDKAIYVLFEPPFYIVRVGDYTNINDAKALSFKLNQLGFSGTKVVNDLINIYK